MIFITGGVGFIGSNFVHEWLASTDEPLAILDKLTYAGNLDNVESVKVDPRFCFVQLDICDRLRVSQLLAEHRPRAIVHFAAESHVDRSIYGPGEFIRTNVNGTFELLEAARAYIGGLTAAEQDSFRFLHVSTDEVYGSLSATDPAFSESSAYAPNSPYAASKAASDHLVRAYAHTYHFPAITTNCSNNYGPYQFPEKLIPLVLLNALDEKPLPVYGDGGQVRDWLYVLDHCSALRVILERGRIGQTYCIGARAERTNLELVRTLCTLLDEMRPRATGQYEQLIEFVSDRPGHDRRYAVSPAKLEQELGWRPHTTFGVGIRQTVHWFLNHEAWARRAGIANVVTDPNRPIPHGDLASRVAVQ